MSKELVAARFAIDSDVIGYLYREGTQVALIPGKWRFDDRLSVTTTRKENFINTTKVCEATEDGYFYGFAFVVAGKIMYLEHFIDGPWHVKKGQRFEFNVTSAEWSHG